MLLKKLKELFQPYHLIHFQMGGFHSNVFVAGSVVDFLVAKKPNNVVVRGMWRITRKEYLRGVEALKKHKEGKYE